MSSGSESKSAPAALIEAESTAAAPIEDETEIEVETAAEVETATEVEEVGSALDGRPYHSFGTAYSHSRAAGNTGNGPPDASWNVALPVPVAPVRDFSYASMREYDRVGMLHGAGLERGLIQADFNVLVRS